MDQLKRYLTPVITAVVLFIVISAAYMSPALEGKNIRQHDIVQHRGMAKELNDFREKTGEEALWTNSLFGGMPAYLLSMKTNSNVMRYLHNIFILGNWRPICFVFLYMLGAYVACLAFGVNPWLSIVGAIAYGFSTYFFIIIEVGHISKVLALGYLPPIVAGVYLAFRGKYLLGGVLTGIALAIQIIVMHLQITYYTLLIILIYGIAELIPVIKNRGEGLRRFITATVVLIFFTMLAVGANMSKLWTTYEYGKFSIRGESELSTDEENRTSGLDKDYATQWSYGVAETFTLLIPNFQGGASGGELPQNSATYEFLKEIQGASNARKSIKQMPTYWGDQPFTAGPVYAGAIAIFLFVLGLLIVKGPLKGWLAAVTIVSVFLAWGHNFTLGAMLQTLMLLAVVALLVDAALRSDARIWKRNLIAMVVSIIGVQILVQILPAGFNVTNFLLDHLPGYNKFRTVSMTLVMADFSIPILGIIAVNRLMNKELAKGMRVKYLLTAFYVTAGLCLLLIIMAPALFDFQAAMDQRYIAQGATQFVDALRTDRLMLLRRDAFRSLVFIALAAVVLYLYLNERIKELGMIGMLGALVLIDMWGINKRYLNNDHFVSNREYETPISMTPADEFILQDKDPNYRVLNLTVSPFQDGTTSYYHKSLGGYHGAKMRRYQELIDYSLQAEMQRIVGALQQGSLSAADSVLSTCNAINMLNTRYIIFNPEGMPLVNKHAEGNAWFVHGIRWAENADREIAMVPALNTGQEATVDVRYRDLVPAGLEKTDSIEGSIDLISYAPNRLVYQSQANADRIAVFSEIYYPKGWHVIIDGEAAEYFRANYVLRGMIVPAGKHEIVFEFRPKAYYTGNKIAMASSSLLLLVLLGIVVMEIRKLLQEKSA